MFPILKKNKQFIVFKTLLQLRIGLTKFISIRIKIINFINSNCLRKWTEKSSKE